MESEFALSRMEIIFLIVAVIVTVPLLVFLRWVLGELKKENSESEK